MNATPDDLSNRAAGALKNGAAGLVGRLLVILLCLAGILFLLYLDSLLGERMDMPLGGQSLNYGLLFLTGLLTGFHCVGMCGPLVLSYTLQAAKQAGISHGVHFYYAAGKTLSYTVIGALFGALGAAVTFTPFLRGMAGIAAGVFLVLFGLHILNVFAGLRHIVIRTPPSLLRFIGANMRKYNHPFIIGLLNGLMIICGPLQAMYILAAGTGSPIEGAKMMFVFGLGTLPLLLGFGVLTSTLSTRLAPKLVKASGFIVIGLGAIMLNRGLAMTGTGYDFDSLVTRYVAASFQAAAGPELHNGRQVIRMDVNGGGYAPNHFTLYKHVPVKWLIEGKEINECNREIVVPKLGLDFEVKKGANVVEFMPRKAGVVPWSCGMGMMRGAFVVEKHTLAAAPAALAASDERPCETRSERWARWLNHAKDRIAATITNLSRKLQRSGPAGER